MTADQSVNSRIASQMFDINLLTSGCTATTFKQSVIQAKHGLNRRSILDLGLEQSVTVTSSLQLTSFVQCAMCILYMHINL